MIKASALYIVIVVALVIAVLCSSLIVTAYFYRDQYQRSFRYDRLQNNLASGINILLADSGLTYTQGKSFSLFNTDQDSVYLKRSRWGVFEIGVSEAFIQRDTLFKTFSIGNQIDSAKWGAVYIVDEDRPVSVSGKTAVRGDAYLPKSGVMQAYVNNTAYTGDKRLIQGKKLLSEKKLPAPDASLIKQIASMGDQSGAGQIGQDSLLQSFLRPVKIFDFGKKTRTLQHIKLAGNIIIRSDTTITIDSTAALTNILVFAPVILVKSGFQGKCQLFAADSISVGKHCIFNYPSCLGIIRMTPPPVARQAKITLDAGTSFAGVIFTSENKPSDLKPIVTISKGDTVKGQIYSQAITELKDHAVVNGSVLTESFLYRSAFTIYVNYLINVTLDSNALSPNYLTSAVLPGALKKKKVLQWLEGN